ncbi:hypothetical protein EA24_08545 [Vibrio navarrensis]|nr:hypothetical protein EA24_08545 [Vibrio navarrensis]
MVLWSCGPVVLWSCGPVEKLRAALGKTRSLVLGKAGTRKSKSRREGSGFWALGPGKSKSGREGSGAWALGSGKSKSGKGRARAEERPLFPRT